MGALLQPNSSPQSQHTPTGRNFYGIFNGASTYDQLCAALERDIDSIGPQIEFKSNSSKLNQANITQSKISMSDQQDSNNKQQFSQYSVHKRVQQPYISNIGSFTSHSSSSSTCTAAACLPKAFFNHAPQSHDRTEPSKNSNNTLNPSSSVANYVNNNTSSTIFTQKDYATVPRVLSIETHDSVNSVSDQPSSSANYPKKRSSVGLLDAWKSTLPKQSQPAFVEAAFSYHPYIKVQMYVALTNTVAVRFLYSHEVELKLNPPGTAARAREAASASHKRESHSMQFVYRNRCAGLQQQHQQQDPEWMMSTRSDTQLTYTQQRLREVTKPIYIQQGRRETPGLTRITSQEQMELNPVEIVRMVAHRELEQMKQPQRSSGSPTVYLLSGGAMFAHPQKRRMGRYSEDAYFIADTGLSVGVADGVGGYSTQGIDSGEYARELMAQAKILAERGDSDPLTILQRSHSRVDLEGASTSCILTLQNHTLKVAHLGDSITVVFRDGKPVFTLEPQQYNFNCPYQMSREDPPEEAEMTEVQVRPGDVIISGSDGLFDNVFLDAMWSTVEGYRRARQSAAVAAESLANIALRNSLDSNFRSPFRLAAAKAGVPFFDGRLSGGKQDDITVVVSFVVPPEEFNKESGVYRADQEAVIRRMYRLQSVEGGAQ